MSVLKNVSYFLAASLLAKPLGFVLSLVLAKSLGPADFGLWVTLMLIITYCPIAHLGTLEALIKEVSFYRGRGDMARVHSVEGDVMGFVIVAASAVALLSVIAYLVLSYTSMQLDPALVALMLLTAATTYFSTFYYCRSTAYENFRHAGMIDFLRAVLALLLIGGLVWPFGLRGAVAGYFLHEIAIFLINRHYNIKESGAVAATFQRKEMWSAIQIGFPITVLWWILTLTGTVDRVVLGSMLGPVAVGEYALGISLGTVVNLLSVVVGRVLYPRVNKELGRNADAESMKRIVLEPTIALGILIVNLQLALAVAMPYLYVHVLPKYHAGLAAGQILILGCYFGCLMRNGANYLVAANQQKFFLKYIVITLVLNVLADIELVRLGLGTAGIALGTSLAGLLLTTLVWRKVFVGLGSSNRASWIALAELYLPVILLCALMGGLHVVSPELFHTVSVLSVASGLGLFLLLNGVLSAFPVYRRQMVTGMQLAGRLTGGFAGRLGLANGGN